MRTSTTAWFFWDCALADGRGVVGRFLEEGPLLSLGERQYLKLMRETTVRLYEVMDVSPANPSRSLSCRRALGAKFGRETASRSLCRGHCSPLAS